MAKVSLDINGRKYALGCDDGEEARLQVLGERLDERIRDLANQFGQIGDLRLLVMAGITMTDEIEDMRETVDSKAEKLTRDIKRASDKAQRNAENAEEHAANALLDAAKRIEKIAAKLNG